MVSFDWAMKKLLRNKANYVCIVLTFICVASCEDILKLDVTGDGNVVKDTLRWRSAFTINEIDLHDNFQLEIYRSEIPALHIETDSNLMIYVKTDFVRNKLTIRRQSDHNLKPSRNIVVRLYINDLSQINVWNRGKILCDTLIAASRLSINIYGKSSFKSNHIYSDNLLFRTEGGANIDIKGEFTSLNYSQIGSGETHLQGETEFLHLTQEGSGKIEALDLTSKYADVVLRHSGLIYCNVSNYLTVDIIGTGRVYYKGDPEVSVEGDGVVEKI